jgi:hypothetical protein
MASTDPALDLSARIENDPIYLAENYLTKYFYLPFAPFQREMLHRLVHSKQRINITFVPRGFGKTTIVSNLLSLFHAIFRGTRYIILVSQTMDKAKQLLEDIKDIISQPEFLDVFGDIQGKPWGAKSARLFSEEFGIDCYIDVLGIGGQVRGLKRRGMRPELALIDDMEDDEDVDNARLVAKTERWVIKKLLPAMRQDESMGKIGQVFWQATTIAGDSAVERVASHEDTLVLRYSALVKSDDEARRFGQPFGSSIWPEKESTEQLHRKRDDLIRRGMSTVWYNEYMNDPRSSDDVVFHDHNMRWFEPEDMDGMETPLAMAIDAAYTEGTQSDELAIVVGGYNYEKKLHIWECVEKRFSPKAFLDEVVRLMKYYASDKVRRPITKIGVESTAYSYLEMVMKERLWEKEGFDVSIKELKHKNVSKPDRCRVLIPLHEQHRLIIKKTVTNIASEMIRFPSQRGGIHGLDAAAYLVKMCWVPAKAANYERMPMESVNRAFHERMEQEEKKKKKTRFDRGMREMGLGRRPILGGKRVR